MSIVALLAIFCFVLSTLPLVSASEDSWTTIDPMPTARGSLGVAVVDGKIYAIGGANITGGSITTNEMYDPETGYWTTQKSMPTDRRNFGITVFQNKIYVLGGDSSSGGPLGTNEVYDPETDSWETKASLPTWRMGLCVETVNEKIYAIGGNRHGVYPVLSNLTEIYDPLSDSWTTGASMPNYGGLGFADITSAVVDNKIYILSCGEREGNGVFTQIYNPETDSWSSAAAIPVMIDYARAVSPSGIFSPKRIHVLGVDYDGHEGESGHQIYDPTEDIWTIGTGLSAPRYDLGLATIDDLLYAIGGGYDNTISDETLMFTPIGYIPEFPSWTILPLFIVVTLLAVIAYKKLEKKKC